MKQLFFTLGMIMVLAACNYLEDLSTLKPAPPNPGTVCAQVYAPVCGSDGKTYSNECEAKKAGITSFTKGACNNHPSCIDPSKVNPEILCPAVYDPVCGCDGKTYGNECEAKKAGITSFTKGACNNHPSCIDPSKVNPAILCPAIYDPVCGCDGKTYGNECEAKKAGVTSFTKGACDNGSSCIDPARINPGVICTMQYDPVCGCDGNTYGNECEALRQGVIRYKKGACSTTGTGVDK